MTFDFSLLLALSTSYIFKQQQLLNLFKLLGSEKIQEVFGIIQQCLTTILATARISRRKTCHNRISTAKKAWARVVSSERDYLEILANPNYSDQDNQKSSDCQPIGSGNAQTIKYPTSRPYIYSYWECHLCYSGNLVASVRCRNASCSHEKCSSCKWLC